MRLFAQLSWYFRREWRRYLGAVGLLIIIAILQLVPPKVVGVLVDGVTRQHYTPSQIMMWIGSLVLIAIVTYLLRYVWRVWLFGASYQLAVELREDFYRQLSRQHPEFYLRHRTGDLIARATNDVDRVVFAAADGVLSRVDSLVLGCVVLGPGEVHKTDIGLTGGGAGKHMVYLSGITDHTIQDAGMVDHIVQLVEAKAAEIEAAKLEAEQSDAGQAQAAE